MKTIVLAVAIVIFLCGYTKHLLHKLRRRKQKRRIERLQNNYKRRFNEGLKQVEDWRNETSDRKHSRQNIICKNPAIAAAWC